jgi:hypothetical protein
VPGKIVWLIVGATRPRALPWADKFDHFGVDYSSR